MEDVAYVQPPKWLAGRVARVYRTACRAPDDSRLSAETTPVHQAPEQTAADPSAAATAAAAAAQAAPAAAAQGLRCCVRASVVVVVVACV